MSERLSVQPLAMSDLDSFVAYRQDPVVARFQGWETSYSEYDARELIESQVGVSIPRQGDWLQLAIHDRHSGELVGDLALHSMTEGDAVYEIGFTLARVNQGRGYASEAGALLVNYLFTEVAASKIVANTDRRNLSSIKLLVTLGFEHQPLRSWNETFKNEEVTMDHFEISRSRFQL